MKIRENDDEFYEVPALVVDRGRDAPGFIASQTVTICFTRDHKNKFAQYLEGDVITLNKDDVHE